jgi:uncharacterized protein with FMN-binding domain
MKKALISLLLIFTFTAYTLYVRIVGADAPFALIPEPNKPTIALSLPQYNNSDTGSNSPTTTPNNTNAKPTTKPSPIPTPTPTPANTGKYRNGTYTGDVVDAYYGNVQVKVTISGGKISDVQFLDHPQGRQTSVRINERAMPYLISEAIVAQSANVDTVSGASFTSAAYRESLSSALVKAKI